MAEVMKWTVTIQAIPIACTYWAGPANATRIQCGIPLASPVQVTGYDCYPYINGIRQTVRYLGDYGDTSYEVIGGALHSGVTPFEVGWAGTQVWGKPVNSPHTIRDAHLDRLCRYDATATYPTDAGPRTSGPFTVLREEVARAIYASLQPLLAASQDLHTQALVALAAVPPDVKKEDHLPFVEAMLRWLDAAQAEALDADATAQSFGITSEQLAYAQDYARLTGKSWTTPQDDEP